MTALTKHDGHEALWYQVFAEGHPVLAGKQKRYGVLPSSPRCKLCEAPFAGPGGWLLRLQGLHRSDRNPSYCNACDGFLDAFPGGAEVPMSMMMVDIRNSVAMSGALSPANFARLVAGLREDVTRILETTDGFLLEFQGDSVFAVWPPGFVGPDHARRAVQAGELAAMAFAGRANRAPAPAGVAIHTGTIYIGTVSAPGGRIQGISAFGLDVNILGRLTHAARPGEVLISRAACVASGLDLQRAVLREERLKGVDNLIEVMVLGDPAPAA